MRVLVIAVLPVPVAVAIPAEIVRVYASRNKSSLNVKYKLGSPKEAAKNS